MSFGAVFDDCCSLRADCRLFGAVCCLVALFAVCCLTPAVVCCGLCVVGWRVLICVCCLWFAVCCLLLDATGCL